MNGSKTASLNLRLGAAPALLLGAKDRVVLNTGTQTIDTKSNKNDFDVQGLLGIGGTLGITNGVTLAFDVTYLRGLLSAYKNSNTYNEGFLFTTGAVF